MERICLRCRRDVPQLTIGGFCYDCETIYAVARGEAMRRAEQEGRALYHFVVREDGSVIFPPRDDAPPAE